MTDTCKNCKQDIVYLDTRHLGEMWVHERSGNQECVFLAEPQGSVIAELAANITTTAEFAEDSDSFEQLAARETKRKAKNK